MAGRKKSRPKGFDPEVWSLLSDDVKGRKDLSKAQKCVYALIVCMSDSYTVDGGWFWRRLDDFLSELEECGMSLSKRELRRILSSLKEIGLIGYIPGHVENGKHVASSFQVVKNQVFNVKNVPLEFGNVIEVSGNQPVMENLSPLIETKLKEKKKNYKDPKETTVLRDTFVERDTIPADAHACVGVGKDFSFSSSSQESKPAVVDRLDLDRAHAKATLMYRTGDITIDEYSDITYNLLQSLSDDDERRSSPIMYRYDSVIEALENVTEEEVLKCSVRGWYFRDRGNKLVRRLKQGEFNTNVQGAWHEMKETLKWLNGLHYRHNGTTLKAYSGTRDEDYQRWKRLCVNALCRAEGEKFAACIPTPNKWN